MDTIRNTYARVAQLVEHDLAKVDVASSNLVSRSKEMPHSGAFSLWGFYSVDDVPRIGKPRLLLTRPNDVVFIFKRDFLRIEGIS